MFDSLYRLIHGESRYETKLRIQEEELKISQEKINREIIAERRRARLLFEAEEANIKPNVTFDAINIQFDKKSKRYKVK